MPEETASITGLTQPHASMDYAYLRQAGIAYIQELAGKVWTDHNAHDPGVTMLETLCYAITDLGYRTNLDMKDLLTVQGSATNQHVHEAGEVATNSPVTERDYRKLLADLPHVRSGWLERSNHSETGEALKGLYEVYVELDEHDDYGDLNDNSLRETLTLPVAPGSPTSADISVEFPEWGKVPEALAEVDPEDTITVTANWLDVAHEPFLHFADLTINGAITIPVRIHILTDHETIYNTTAFSTLMRNEFVTNGTTVKQFVERWILIKNILGEISDALHANRNLCEDFLSITPINLQEIGVELELDVTDGAEYEEVQAQVYLAMRNFINPQTRFYSALELLNKGYRADEVFEGPLLQNGFLIDAEMDPMDQRETLFLSDLVRVVMGVAGVEEVRKITASNYVAGDLVTSESDNCLELIYPKRFLPRFNDEQSAIRFVRPGMVPGKADSALVQKRYAELVALSRGSLNRNDLAAFGLPEGEFADAANYYSIQHDLPLAYGQGLHAQRATEHPGTVLQLKGFQLFFEQLFAGYLKQLGALRELFSPVSDLGSTYPNQITQGPGVQQVMISFTNYALANDLDAEDPTVFEAYLLASSTGNLAPEHDFLGSVETISEDNDMFEERRNRFLDHLLGRFAESFTDYAIYLQDELGEADAAARLIADKSAFLQAYPQLSGARGTGLNYKQQELNIGQDVWDNTNNTGLKDRVAGLLGLGTLNHGFIGSSAAFNIEASQDGKYYFELFHPKDNVRMLHSAEGYNTAFEARSAAIELVEAALDASNYQQQNDGVQYWIEISNTSGVLASSLLEPEWSSTDSDAALTRLQAYIIEITEQFNFHIVENILLRTRANGAPALLKPKIEDLHPCLNEDDPYSFRVNVVLPAWTSKSKDESFQRLLKRTLREETPAHVHLEFYWVNQDEMAEFEECYRELLLDLNGSYGDTDIDNLALWLDHKHQPVVNASYRLSDLSGNSNEAALHTGHCLTTGTSSTSMVSSKTTVPGIHGASELTVAAWVYVNSEPSTQNYYVSIPETEDGTQGIALYHHRSSNQMKFVVYNGTNWNEAYAPQQLNSWVRMVGTMGNGQVRLYLNGTLMHIKTGATGTAVANVEKVFLGVFSDHTSVQDRDADCKLSDVQIWNKAWTEDEVAYDYINRETSMLEKPGTALKPSNLELWWPLTEGAGNRVYDAGPNRHYGVVSSEITWLTGENVIPQTALMNFSRKMLMDDDANNYVNASPPDELRQSISQVTVSAYISMERTERSGHLYAGGFLLYGFGQGHYFFTKHTDGSLVYTPAFNHAADSDKPFHFVGTFDGTTCKTYVNGKYQYSRSCSFPILPSTLIQIGYYVSVDWINTGFTDECTIFDAAFTEDEVAELYNGGKILDARQHSQKDKLLSYWKNNPINNVWHDLSVNANHGVMYNSPNVITLREGYIRGRDAWGTEINRKREPKTLNLDGSGYGVVQHDSSLDLSGDFTLETWVKPVGYHGTVFSKGTGSDRLAVNFENYELWAGHNVELTGDRAEVLMEQERWEHLVAVYRSATSDWTYYRNGYPAGTYHDYDPSVQSGDPLYIGDVSTLTDAMEGLLGPIRIYDGKAFTAVQARKHFLTEKPAAANQGQGGLQTPGVALSIAGDAQEASGSAYDLTDQSSNGNHAALFSGKAFQTNGVTTHNISATISGMHNSLQATMACWIYPLDPNTSYSSNYYCNLAYRTNVAQGFLFYTNSSVIGQLTATLRTFGGTQTIYTTMTAGQWNRVVGTYDGSTFKVYVNGVEMGSASLTGNIDNDSSMVFLGNATDLVAGPSAAKFSDFQLWNKGWTADEVTYDYQNATRLALHESNSNLDHANLVTWWPLTEGVGSNAWDSAGNGNEGQIEGGVWLTGEQTVPQTALLGLSSKTILEGALDHYLEADYPHVNSSAITVSVWASFEQLTYGGIIGDWHAASADRAFLVANLSSSLAFYIRTKTNGAAAATIAHSSLDASKLYHIVGVYTGSSVQLYLDGSLVDSTSLSGEMQDSKGIVEIGRYEGVNPFSGFIDEASIFNVALSASEVTELYNSGQALNALTHTQAANLDRYWRNNPVAGKWEELSGSHDDMLLYGTFQQATLVESVAGGSDGATGSPINRSRAATALNLDGSSYARIDADFTLDVASDFTLEAWVKSLGSGGTIFSKGLVNIDRLALTVDGDQAVWAGYNREVFAEKANTNLRPGNWDHVMAVYRNDTRQWSYYINGLPAGVYTETDADMQAGADLYLGRAAGAANYFDGQFGPIQLHDQIVFNDIEAYAHFEAQEAPEALPLTEIVTNNLALWTEADVLEPAPAFGTISDQSTKGNRALLHTGTAIQSTGTEALAHRTGLTGIDGLTELTMACWIKPAGSVTTSTQNFFVSIPHTGGQPGLGFFHSTNTPNSMHACIRLSTGLEVAYSAAVEPGMWNRLVSTYDGHDFRFYVNGVEVASSEAEGTVVSATNELFLGSVSTENGWFAKGSYSDLQLWNDAWSPVDVAFDFANPHQSVLEADTVNLVKEDLLGWWPMAEGYGRTMFDISGKDLHAGITNWAWEHAQPMIPQTALQSFSKKTVFEGIDDSYVEGAMAHTDWPTITVSAWVTFDQLVRSGVAGDYNAGSSSQQGFLIYLSDNNLVFFVRNQSGTAVGATWNQSNLETNRLYHIVGVYDSVAQLVYLYVDGVQRDTSSHTGLIRDGRGVMTVGHYAGPYPFYGLIDEVSVFSNAFNAAQVTELYNSGAPLDATTHSQSANLAGYWRNNPLGGSWAELSGNAAKLDPYGTVNEITIIENTDSANEMVLGSPLNRLRADNVLNLDGSGYALIGANESLDLSRNITIEAWIRPYGTSGTILEKGTHEADRLTLEYTGFQARAGQNTNGGSELSTTTWTAGSWAHLMAVYTQVDSTWRYYHNGVASGSYVETDPGVQLGAPMYIGASQGTGGFASAQVGAIRIYDGLGFKATRVLEQYQLQSAPSYAGITIPDVQNNLGVWMDPGTAGASNANGRIPDQSDNNNRTTLHSGRAFKTNGSTAYAVTNDLTGIDGTNTITVATWLKINSLTGTANRNYFLSMGRTDVNAGISFQHYQDGDPDNIMFTINLQGSSSSSWRGITSTMTQNSWHRLVMTYDGSVVRAYMDGVQVGTNSYTGTITHSTDQLVLGQFHPDHSNGLYGDGSFSDVQVWNKAWDANEVLFDYEQPEQRAHEYEGSTLTAEDNLLWWPLIEGIGGMVTDASGNGRDGQTVDAAWELAQPKILQPALMSYSAKSFFSKSISNYLDTEFDRTDWTEMTLSAWVSFEQLVRMGILGDWYTAGSKSSMLYASDTTALFVVQDTTQSNAVYPGYSLSSMETNRFYHLVGSYDGEYARFYVDGVERASAAQDEMDLGYGRMMIGQYGSFPFHGFIDECSVFDVALSSQEVLELYNQGKPLDAREHSAWYRLRGYWRNNPINDIWPDLSGYGRDMVRTGSLRQGLVPELIPGHDAWFNVPLNRVRNDQALNLDGDSYAVVPHDTTLVPSSEMTLEGWVNPTDAKNNVVLTKGSSSSDRYFMMLFQNTDQRILGGIDGYETESTSGMALFSWAHVAAVYSGSIWTYYLNGVAVGTSSEGSTFTNTSSDLYIGGTEFSTNYFAGQLGQVRFYTEALSADVVKNHFEMDRHRYGV